MRVGRNQARPKNWLEVIEKLGPWAPLVIIPWLLYRFKAWDLNTLLRDRFLQRLVVASVIFLIIYYSGFFYWRHNRGLPKRFEDGAIGILIAELPHQADRNGQLIYERALRQAFDAAPQLTRRASIQLIRRPLPEGDQVAHQEAMELGDRLNAWYVVRSIPRPLPASTTWRRSTTSKGVTTRPSRSTNAPSPSGRKRWGPSIPIPLPASTTWRRSTTNKGATRRPGPFVSAPSAYSKKR